MNLVNVKANAYIDFNVEKMTKILNLKLMVIWEYQNIKAFLKNFIFQIGLKKFLWSKNLIEYLKGKEVAATFCEKIANTNQTKFRVEKVMKKKADIMCSVKSCNNSCNSCIDKNRYCYMKWVILPNRIPMVKRK